MCWILGIYILIMIDWFDKLLIFEVLDEEFLWVFLIIKVFFIMMEVVVFKFFGEFIEEE